MQRRQDGLGFDPKKKLPPCLVGHMRKLCACGQEKRKEMMLTHSFQFVRD